MTLESLTLFLMLAPPTPEGRAEEATPGPGEETVESEEVSLDSTEFSIGAGLNGSSGNARSVASSGVLDARIRRGAHQFTAKGLHAGGSSAPNTDEVLVPNVSRQMLRARYDYLLPLCFLVFTQLQWRRDLFQGLRTRVNADVGPGYYAVDVPNHRLLFTVSYDYQYDWRTDWQTYETTDGGLIVLDDQGQPNRVLPVAFHSHQARLLAATENDIRGQAQINASLEYLQNFVERDRFLINFEASIAAKVIGGFSISLNFLLQHENRPLPFVLKTDTTTSFNLLYRIDDAEIEATRERRRARARRRFEAKQRR